MLAELRDAHAEIVAWIDELELLTSFEMPDRVQLTGVRWRLSQASRRRSDIIESNVYRALLSGADGAEREQLLKLKAIGVELRQYSARHVNEWTIEKIVEDWPGYCRASLAMRNSMRARIEEERRVLYPLLSS
ncbi:hypothetical protein SAMN05444678_101212 [Sphingomonas sp. YR710]|jgi:hypothetical protein|uniref:hypothetical protein n=1 Tax=Sphingomonas sp. YR710 TaxID=1882773 RepID=UPI0008863A92|nr:hypothetical protein [Sphingomonas sp. YR710]SDC04594.1 hypothetical protein SAMN05444678_101212 [Sphingomonas sp. YR710]